MYTSKALLFLFFVFVISTLHAQKQIEIKYSGFLEFKEAEAPGLKIMTRDNASQIHVLHEGINMWCDKALLYSEDNFVEAYGNVKMVQGDTIKMTSKYVEYSGKTKLAFASGNVVLKDPTSTLTTDSLFFNRNKQQAYYRTKGKVVRDSSGTITSKIGLYDMPKKKYKFVKNVKIVHPDYTIKTNYLDFFTETGFAYLYGPSTITTETSKTYCEKGFFNTQKKQGYAVKNSKIEYDNRIIEGDSLYFDNTKSFASASNNIKVTDTINNSIVKGHYAEVYKEKDSVFITKRALAVSLQENDSIYLHADRLVVTGKPENRVTRAYKNAKLFKTDLSGKADSIHVDHSSGIIQLINKGTGTASAFDIERKPILWNLENQMTGDTIQIRTNPKTEKIDSMLVFNNAFLISKDTISENSFNQIKGKILTAFFDDENKIKQVDIDKNAESIFFARDDNQELFGIDKAKSGKISIRFHAGEIEQYIRYKQVEAKLYPESMFPNNIRLFKGFVWREEERPKSVADLFAEDPPLELPVIKGLEDYKPEEPFFNDSLLGRIEKADQEEQSKQKQAVKVSKAAVKMQTSKKKFKASRKLPNSIINAKKKKPTSPKPKSK